MTEVTVVLQTTTVALAAWLAVSLLRGAPASTRAAIWTCAILVILLVPALQLPGPVWRLTAVDYAIVGMHQLASTVPMSPSAIPVGSSPPNIGARTVVTFVWGAVALLLLLRLGVGYVSLLRKARQARPIQEACWLEDLAELSAALGVRRRVLLCTTVEMDAPATFGVLRPVVFFPVTANQWTAAQRRSVLLHELSHVKRLDALAAICVSIAACIHWFNPVVLAATRRLIAEQEHACDDVVLRSGVLPSDYVRHLADVIRSARAESRLLPLPALTGRAGLPERAIGLLAPDRLHRLHRRSRPRIACGAFCAAVLPLMFVGRAEVADLRNIAREIDAVSVSGADSMLGPAPAIPPDTRQTPELERLRPPPPATEGAAGIPPTLSNTGTAARQDGGPALGGQAQPDPGPSAVDRTTPQHVDGSAAAAGAPAVRPERVPFLRSDLMPAAPRNDNEAESNASREAAVGATAAPN